MRIGYFLSSEEFAPKQLVEQAQLAQQAGLDRLWISDHYHPWNEQQGNSPFVWSVIGALSQAVPGIHVTTAVTCPTLRIHPAVIAQAAATSAVLLEGRFSLGVGSGEALNPAQFGQLRGNGPPPPPRLAPYGMQTWRSPAGGLEWRGPGGLRPTSPPGRPRPRRAPR